MKLVLAGLIALTPNMYGMIQKERVSAASVPNQIQAEVLLLAGSLNARNSPISLTDLILGAQGIADRCNTDVAAVMFRLFDRGITAAGVWRNFVSVGTHAALKEIIKECAEGFFDETSVLPLILYNPSLALDRNFLCAALCSGSAQFLEFLVSLKNFQIILMMQDIIPQVESSSHNWQEKALIVERIVNIRCPDLLGREYPAAYPIEIPRVATNGTSCAHLPQDIERFLLSVIDEQAKLSVKAYNK